MSTVPRRFPLLLLAFAVAGCSQKPLVEDAPDPTLPSAYPNHSAEQIAEAVRASLAGVAWYATDGDIEIESPSLNQSATFSLRARMRDTVQTTLRGPFGVVAARALVTRDSFLAQDVFGKKLYVGRVDVAERYVPGAGSQEALARAAGGLIVPDPAREWRVTPKDGTYVLSTARPDRSRRVYVVDPALWRVVQAQEVDAAGVVVADQTFSAFDTVGGVVVPRRVVLRAPGEAVRVTLEHDRYRVNPDDFEIRWRRPGSRVIAID